MKLLSKKLVQAGYQTERKQQIDQGLDLAKKVDVLRETKSKEERELEEFRKNSVAQVKVEIDGLLKDKDSLIGEIQSLREEKARQQVPLDAEIERLRGDRQKLATFEDKLNSREESLNQKQDELAASEHELEDEKQRIAELKERAGEFLVRAQTKYGLASLLTEEAQRNKKDAEKFFAAKKSELVERESALENREAVLGDRERQVDKKNEENRVREIQLQDQRETLERAMKRLTK